MMDGGGGGKRGKQGDHQEQGNDVDEHGGSCNASGDGGRDNDDD